MSSDDEMPVADPEDWTDILGQFESEWSTLDLLLLKRQLFCSWYRKHHGEAYCVSGRTYIVLDGDVSVCSRIIDLIFDTLHVRGAEMVHHSTGLVEGPPRTGMLIAW